MGFEAALLVGGVVELGEGVADFKAAVEALNSVDPGCYTFRLPVDPKAQDSVRDFGRKMDALLELLDSTADELAAEWDLRSEAAAIEDDRDDGGFKPVIH